MTFREKNNTDVCPRELDIINYSSTRRGGRPDTIIVQPAVAT